jgi:hypothetical protein
LCAPWQFPLRPESRGTAWRGLTDHLRTAHRFKSCVCRHDPPSLRPRSSRCRVLVNSTWRRDGIEGADL